MKNLLIITQKVDKNDDLLGFFVDWIREFSNKFDKVFVITLAVGEYHLPENVLVYSLGKEDNSSKIIRLLRFYKFLFHLTPKANAIFAHMSPVFVIASWPAAFLFRKRIIFWYLHRSVTLRLKIAEKLCYKIVTAARESLKFESKKIIETGHGILTENFKTERNWNGETVLNILSVGRISKIKNYDTILRAAKILKDKDVNFTWKILGRPVMPADNSYFDSLKVLMEQLDLGSSVEFIGFVPYSRIAEYYKKSNLVIGLTPEGGIDKTILEGMASGCLTLTSNRACKRYFGEYSQQLIFEYQNSEDLANKIIFIQSLSANNKKQISDFLVESVSAHHNLQNLINRITSL